MLRALFNNRKIRLAAAVSAFTCLAFGGASLAQRAGDGVAAQAPAPLQGRLEDILKAGKTNDVTFIAPAVMRAFYAERGDAPYWVGFFGVNRPGRMVLAKFENAWSHGLSPERYHLSAIKTLMESGSPADEATLELLLTDGYIRYVQDLTGLSPAAAFSLGLEPTHWLRSASSMEALSWLDHSASLKEKLTSIEPSGPVYTRFSREFARLSSMQDPAYEAVLPILAEAPIKPGEANKAIPLIRERLGLAQPAKGKWVYDDTLAAAVMAFQRKSGVLADGILITETIALLNETRKDRLIRLVANMERMRWVPRDLGEKYVVVNIPSATLWAVEGGKVAFEMPVIVGKPERPTPAFRADITGMRLNPDWTIPPTIKLKDILPKIQEDVNFLNDRNIALSTLSNGRRVALDPLSIDWATISSRALSQIDMVQVPGDDNPLGRYRVLMPNVYNIYLHDTNHPDMFDFAVRNFSSGCMRMKDPAKMAAFVLDREKGWDQARIDRAVASQRRIDVPIATPIPVYAVYYSAWLGKDGEIIYGPDIYSADRKLYDALFAREGLPPDQETVNGSQVSLAQP
jgi:murein L,D-transpeptidase YcbB/YkuD